VKSIKIFAARAKLQAAAGTPVVPANTDALLLAERPDLAIGYAHDGTRTAPAGTMGHQRRVKPSGRTGETSLKLEPRGAGAAYGAAVLPNLHVLARIMGLDAAIDTTLNAEKVTYTPSPGPGGFAVASIDLFGRAQQYTLTDVIGDFTLGASGPEVPILEVPIKGLLPTIADAAVPDMLVTLQGIDAILPPKSEQLGFKFNTVPNLELKKWSISFGRTNNPALNQNVGGHSGFRNSGRGPMLTFTVANELLSVIDFYALRDSATQSPWEMQHGTVKYNKHKLFGPAAQVVDVKDSDEDPTACIDVSCQLNPSAYGLNDEFTWLFD
jgi:hypothetical protein